MSQQPTNPYGGVPTPGAGDPTLGVTGDLTGGPASPDGPDTGYGVTGSGDRSGATGTGGTSTGEGSGKADAAKDEARKVADTATSAGGNVAQTAKDQASNVAAEAKDQASSLLHTVRSEVGQQAGTQQQRIADAVHGLSQELGSMASGSSESGYVTDLAHEASRRGGELAHWLQEREPADVLEAVRSYARRKPVAFLALCGLAGVVAGRLTRGVVASRTSLDSPDSGSSRSLSAGGSTDAGLDRPTGYQPALQPAPSVVESAPVGYQSGAATSPAPAIQEPLETGFEGTRTGGAGIDPLAPGGDPTR